MLYFVVNKYFFLFKDALKTNFDLFLSNVNVLLNLYLKNNALPKEIIITMFTQLHAGS